MYSQTETRNLWINLQLPGKGKDQNCLPNNCFFHKRHWFTTWCINHLLLMRQIAQLYLTFTIYSYNAEFQTRHLLVRRRFPHRGFWRFKGCSAWNWSESNHATALDETNPSFVKTWEISPKRWVHKPQNWEKVCPQVEADSGFSQFLKIKPFANECGTFRLLLIRKKSGAISIAIT